MYDGTLARKQTRENFPIPGDRKKFNRRRLLFSRKVGPSIVEGIFNAARRIFRSKCRTRSFVTATHETDAISGLARNPRSSRPRKSGVHLHVRYVHTII